MYDVKVRIVETIKTAIKKIYGKINIYTEDNEKIKIVKTGRKNLKNY